MNLRNPPVSLFNIKYVLILTVIARLCQKPVSSPKFSIGDMAFCYKVIDSRLKHAGMTAFWYCCKSLFMFALFLPVITGCATVEVNESIEGPYIVSTYPSPGDFNISRHADISIRFNESMDAETQAEFKILLSGSKVEGDTRWSDSNTMLSFRPYKPLEQNSLYQCIIGIGKSKEGKGLRGAPYIWMFSTGN